MSAKSLPIDVRVRDLRDRIAIVASGLGDPGEAEQIVRELAELLAGGAYDIVLRGSPSAERPAQEAAHSDGGPSKPIRLASKYTGRCRKCGAAYEEGDPIFWTRGVKGAECVECGGKP